MAKKIVGLLKPFILKQDFYVYEDSNKIDAFSVNINEINEKVLELAEKYSITQLDLIGPQQYSRGIGEKIRLAELKKYTFNKLEINYL